MLDPERWLSLMTCSSLACDPSDYQTLATMLAKPGRAYHNASHIVDCLSQLDACETDCVNIDDVEFAIWLHDAV